MSIIALSIRERYSIWYDCFTGGCAVKKVMRKLKIEKRSRKKLNQPTDELRNLLEICDLIPQNAELPNCYDDYLKIFKKISGREAVHYEDLLQPTLDSDKRITDTFFGNMLLQSIKKYPKLEKYLIGKQANAQQINFNCLRLDLMEIYSIESNLHNLALFAYERFEGEFREFKQEDGLPVLTNAFIDERGRFRFSDNKIIQSLEGVDAKRLKICPRCSRVFWAYRANQSYCEKKCSNAFIHKQILKDPDKREKINNDRRKNYYKDNRIPYCEKCIRPHSKCKCYEDERRKK